MSDSAAPHVPSSRSSRAASALTVLHTSHGSLTDLSGSRRQSLPSHRPPSPPSLDTSAPPTRRPSLAPPPPSSSSGASSALSSYLQSVGVLNSLLLFAPPALLLRVLHSHPPLQFGLACLSIVPLAGFLGEATEHLSDRLGPGTGGLLNATFGNAAELIIASFSVFRSLDSLVKSSLVGSIIGNLLLVLGGSILCGGMRFQSQSFSINAANIDSNMAVVAAIGFLVPSMFHHLNAAAGDGEAAEHKLSLGISSIFLLTYLFMLFFQLKTHSYFFNQHIQVAAKALGVGGQPSSSSPSAHPSETSALLLRSLPATSPFSAPGLRRPTTSSFHIPRSFRKVIAAQRTRNNSHSDGTTTPRSAGTPTTPSYERLGRALDRQGSLKKDEYGATLVDVFEEDGGGGGTGGGAMDEGKEGGGAAAAAAPLLPGVDVQHVVEVELEDSWTMRKSLLVLCTSTLGIVLLSEVLTGAVEQAGAALGLSHLFVGVIIVAIVGNAAEHTTAVISALHNDMDIAISIAFGSALQIAMFVMPVIVLLSYLREGAPMDLTLSEMEVFGVTSATVISWMVVQDGASTWLEGLMLLVIYLILGLAFFFSHDDE